MLFKNFIFNYSWLSILFYISFRCTAQWLDNYIVYEVIPWQCKHRLGTIHNYYNIIDYSSYAVTLLPHHRCYWWCSSLIDIIIYITVISHKNCRYTVCSNIGTFKKHIMLTLHSNILNRKDLKKTEQDGTLNNAILCCKAFCTMTFKTIAYIILIK